MKARLLYGIMGLFLATNARAQIFAADTGGKGLQTIFASWSVSESQGSVGRGGYIQYVYGLSAKLDGFAVLGTSRVPGEHQEYIGLGLNRHLWKSGEVNWSFFNQLTKPANQTDKSSTLLLDSAIIASHAFGNFTVYAAANLLAPVGKSSQATFSPRGREFNLPIGFSLAHGKWAWYTEADIGHLHLLGTGISWSH